MRPYEIVQQEIINSLRLELTAREDKMLRLKLTRLFTTGASEAFRLVEKPEQQKGDKESMTEKEVLEARIGNLRERRRLITAEIDLELRLLEEALALQSGFERGGKNGFIKFGQEFFDEDY